MGHAQDGKNRVKLFQELAEEFSLIRMKEKRPIEKDWQKYCSQKRRFEEIGFEADDNAGIACGPASDTLVLDVDNKELFEEACKKHGWKIPDTRTIRTGAGKPHHYFGYPNNENKYGNRSFKQLGFDIRGFGGVVVAPGSIHPDTGKPYHVLVDAPKAPAPDWLLDLYDSQESEVHQIMDWPVTIDDDFMDRVQITKETERLIREGKPKGKRSEAIMTVVNALVSAGLSDEQIIQVFEKFPIGEKYQEKGDSKQEWLHRHIRKAKIFVASTTRPRKKQVTQAQTLVELGKKAELYHAPDGNAYAKIEVDDHEENWNIRSNDFRRLLGYRFYQSKGKPPGRQALQDALNTLEGEAQFGSPEISVFTRIADLAGNIYIDLANDKWEAVEITPWGWSIIKNLPVRFRRAKGMLPLPRPQQGGSLSDLRSLLNASDDNAWTLILSWIAGAARPSGPYPILNLEGEQGTGKTFATRIIRSLIDPSAAPVRTTSRNERDLLIAARNGWVIALDNLSGLRPWLSDALCRLSTGGGFSTRELYSNDEEVIFDAVRPVILNGIDQIAFRHDLVDRSIILNLPVIRDDKRLTEKELWTRFEVMHPKILGALCDALTEGLRNISQIELDKLPRMADFALWVKATEPALPWEQGQFMNAYEGNRAVAIDVTLEGDPVACAVRDLIESKSEGEWYGTASQLLEELRMYASEGVIVTRAWPRDPRSLGRRLRRIATFLRSVGISVSFNRDSDHSRRRIISLEWVSNSLSETSYMSVSTADKD